ncbi:MAG: phenylalanine--tRNA ligase subunit beta, partial [Elusimicrobia bacterium]|nr:phenylalanine--tRNA ligase subunit beta [Elusimicrobiota bacterium]
MKLSLNWLNQYIDHGLSADELAHRMTMAGLEVEHIERVGEDTVFEIEVTPNRPDALSILGLAREVSAIVDKDLKAPEVSDLEDAGSVDIAIEDAEGCGRYIGTVIEGVSVKASPLDQQKLLGAMGSNGISNIVDITNFVLFEYGQPLHAFDLDKLEGGKIIIRRAKRGEKITTLDGIERALDESILVIADAKKPVAIAGIMGGMATGVTASTRRVILESAYFDLGIVRRASRRLGLTSDAAYRFERGVAFRTVETASNRAADLILKMAGGQIVARRDVVAREVKAARQEIQVSQNDIENLIGASLDAPRCEKILKRLGCIVAPGKKSLVVIPPHWRGDLKIKEDVIEEVGRVIGYDNLPQSLPRVQAINIPVDLNREDFFNKASEILVGQGLNQIMTYSLISRAALENVRYAGTKPVALQNPMSAEQEIMPPTLMPGFLNVAAFNIHRGARDLGLFEVAKRYLPGGERWTLGILLTGR